LLAAGLIVFLVYRSSSPLAESAQGGDSQVEIDAVLESGEPASMSAYLAAERARAEERDRNDPGRVFSVREKPQEPISELEDRARERRSSPGKSPMPD